LGFFFKKNNITLFKNKTRIGSRDSAQYAVGLINDALIYKQLLKFDASTLAATAALIALDSMNELPTPIDAQRLCIAIGVDYLKIKGMFIVFYSIEQISGSINVTKIDCCQTLFLKKFQSSKWLQ
jgi:hypothetical protein